MPSDPHHIAAPACPYCEAKDSEVLETRDSPDGETRRRRECRFCRRRFTTYERVVAPNREGRHDANVLPHRPDESPDQ